MSYIINYLDGNVPMYIIIVLILLSGLIQISPLKLNPWTTIHAYLSAPLRTEKLLVGLKDDVDNLRFDFERDKAINARIRILSFGESLIRRGQSTKERFDQIMEDIDIYEKYCVEHPEFKNNKTVLTTQYIRDKYYKCLNHEEEFLEING